MTSNHATHFHTDEYFQGNLLNDQQPCNLLLALGLIVFSQDKLLPYNHEYIWGQLPIMGNEYFHGNDQGLIAGSV